MHAASLLALLAAFGAVSAVPQVITQVRCALCPVPASIGVVVLFSLLYRATLC